MFIDKETDTHKLVKKYQTRGFLDSAVDFFTQKIGIDNSRINQIDLDCKNHASNKPDTEFVQELVNSTLFGEFIDIKQKVLNAFLDEYQKWRKETFPSNVKEIVPKFSLNKQLKSKLDEEFSREKKEIERKEFERICSELEEKYRNG